MFLPKSIYFLLDILAQSRDIQLDGSLFVFRVLRLRMNDFVDCNSHFQSDLLVITGEHSPLCDFLGLHGDLIIQDLLVSQEVDDLDGDFIVPKGGIEGEGLLLARK